MDPFSSSSSSSSSSRQSGQPCSTRRTFPEMKMILSSGPPPDFHDCTPRHKSPLRITPNLVLLDGRAEGRTPGARGNEERERESFSLIDRGVQRGKNKSQTRYKIQEEKHRQKDVPKQFISSAKSVSSCVVYYRKITSKLLSTCKLLLKISAPDQYWRPQRYL